MKQYPVEQIRNVGLFSHGGSGKTSLTEALLHAAKATTRIGRVEDGNTVTDFDPDEIKRVMSISVSIAPIEWRDTKINLLDSPGYADFLGEVKSALRVVDAAVILLDASAGVEVGTEQAWKLAEASSIPRILFVNKMDRENANFDQALESARSTFGSLVAPVHVPIGSEKSFRGIVDLLNEEAILFEDGGNGSFTTGPIPDDLADVCAGYRQQLIESICETDEDLMMRYLDDDEISNEELLNGLRECVKTGEVVPVLAGAATSARGAAHLLDAIVDYFPAPSERVSVAHANGADEQLAADPAGPLAVLVFKTIADPHVGRLSYFRVYSGSLHSNSQVYNPVAEKTERIGQLFYVRGKEHINTDTVTAGDIAAVGKLNVTHTGETLCDEGHPLRLDGIEFPQPAYSAAVNPKTKADLDKMGQGLQRMIEEDPTLQLGRDTVTGETLLSGLGEPHVQIALERMTRRYNVNVDVGLPRVQYRETIAGKTVAEYKHKKQTGGAGQYGHVLLELEPLPDADFEFGERVVGGAVPRNFFPAVEKGVREALEAGPLAGYPVVNVKVTLFDGSYHDVDSNEMAFKIASKEAFKKGVLQAQPTLLEPVMTVQVTIPDNFTGDVMSDLNGKRAQVSGMNPGDNGTTTIEALVPASEIQRYATDLRSITQGRGTFTTSFSHYQPVPVHLAEQIKAEAKEHEGTAA